jgi:N-acetylmuramoyl-L-alanine amidase
MVLLAGTYIKLAGLEAGYQVEATSWKVANRVVVIDPGHGGIDPGAIGSGGTIEKEVVLEIAKKLKTLLSQAGAVVVMTRETDKDLSDPGGRPSARKRQDLTRRVELAHRHKADLYLGIHVNSIPSPRWRGAQTFYQRGQEDAKKLAECIQQELRSVLKNTEREVKGEDFFTNRQTKMTSVIVEVGFVSNPAEEKLLNDPAYQQKVAWAIYAGVAKYLAGK